MSEPTRTTAPDGVAPATRYAHVVAATGRFVAVAGQLAIDEHGAVVRPELLMEIEAFAVLGA
ncbi:hypothetical protein ABT330_24290 [Streptomyces sp. NPDC000658]|uniref:hypothetical protein n=1 Tax=Streptomyces sp. NPDC000658 TaxID=3154266 RepID=UPI00331C9137